jgi:hypothetical protein
MVLFLVIAGMFALPVAFAAGLFVVAHFGPFLGIDLNALLGTDAAEQAAAGPVRPTATSAQEPARPVKRAA